MIKIDVHYVRNVMSPSSSRQRTVELSPVLINCQLTIAVIVVLGHVAYPNENARKFKRQK